MTCTTSTWTHGSGMKCKRCSFNLQESRKTLVNRIPFVNDWRNYAQCWPFYLLTSSNSDPSFLLSPLSILSFPFSVVLTFSCDPPRLVVGAFPSRVPWAGLGTPSLPCHQTTSSYSEDSQQRERHWVSLTLCSGVANNPQNTIAGIKKVSSVFQVMLGCTLWAKMNGSLSNTVTQSDRGKSCRLGFSLMTAHWFLCLFVKADSYCTQTVVDIALCVSGCGIQHAPAPMERCLCSEGVPTTFCLTTEL